YQHKRIKITQLFTTQKYGVSLVKDRLYYVEIFQTGRKFSKYRLQWRKQNASVGYETIGAENLLFTNDTRTIPSQIMQKRIYKEKYPVGEAEE
ncbi:hypothetical protein, partial [Acinetobacter baumannii]|uniref:hypothetical protein n=1 Tax=Acinetobacter baumannii TaxID=470 RepID=UPI00197AA591